MLVILAVPIVSDCLLMMSWALGTLVIVVAVVIASLTVVVITIGRGGHWTCDGRRRHRQRW